MEHTEWCGKGEDKIEWSARKQQNLGAGFLVKIHGIGWLMPSTIKKIKERIRIDYYKDHWLEWYIGYYHLADVRLIVWQIIACIEKERELLRRARLVDYQFEQVNEIFYYSAFENDDDMEYTLLKDPTICTLIDIINTGAAILPRELLCEIAKHLIAAS